MPPTLKATQKKGSIKATRRIPVFYRLPTELRLKIWWLTVEPRQVVIWQHRSYLEDVYFRNTPFPVALHVCRESRTELLQQYTPLSLPRPLSLHRQKRHCYNTRPRPRINYFSPCQKRRSVYFADGRKHYDNCVNFAIDTVVFPGDNDRSMVHKALRGKLQFIQSVAIGLDMHEKIGDNNMRLLLQLSSVNSIYVILGGMGGYRFNGYNYKLYDPSTRYELSLDGAPQGYTWSCLLSSYRRLIAKDWGQNPVPLQGLLAHEEPSPDSVPANQLYCGDFCDWMVVTT
jgi:hypothetical protein